MITMPTASTVSPRLMLALDHAWSAIRSRHPEVPEVVVTIGFGTDGRRGTQRLGHFAPDRWQRGDGRLPEMFIGGEGLARGPVPVLGTLLHEATHGLAAARKIQDTSRQGRYHNGRFRVLATEMGITVVKVRSIGWSETTVPDTTARRYRAELRRLEAAITAYRHAERHGGRNRASSNNGVSASCACGRKIRVARSVLDLGPIECILCGSDFEGQGE